MITIKLPIKGEVIIHAQGTTPEEVKQDFYEKLLSLEIAANASKGRINLSIDDPMVDSFILKNLNRLDILKLL